MDFQGKVCVVTGGANGIGRCIAEQFARAGASVAAIDTDAGAGEKLVRQNAGVWFSHGDIAEERVLKDFAQQVIEKYGRVDYLINNACVIRKGILTGMDFDEFNYVLRVGITAPYMFSKLFMDHFAPGASIINISSIRAFMSQPDTESYSAVKGGILSLTHSLAMSLAGRVRVNCISPGWIDTSAYHSKPSDYVLTEADLKQHPVRRVGDPLDIARMVMYLCSDEASFITGENFKVDGGMSRQLCFDREFGWRFDPEEME